MSNKPTPNHEDKETSPNGRNATPSRSRGAGAFGIATGLRRRYVNMFEGPVTGNIPEDLDNGEVTPCSHSRSSTGGAPLAEAKNHSSLRRQNTFLRKTNTEPPDGFLCSPLRRHGLRTKPARPHKLRGHQTCLLSSNPFRKSQLLEPQRLSTKQAAPLALNSTRAQPTRTCCFLSAPQKCWPWRQLGAAAAVSGACGLRSTNERAHADTSLRCENALARDNGKSVRVITG